MLKNRNIYIVLILINKYELYISKINDNLARRFA